LLGWGWLSVRAKACVWINVVSVQPGGSLNIRGALTALHVLRAGRPDISTVVTASAGNHGTAMAIAARQFGLRLRVHLPATAPDAKRQGLLSQGAELVESADYDQAEAAARADADESGAPYISPYNHPDVIAGAGTVALEMLEDEPALSALVIPLGGGGLLAGAALVAQGHVRPVRVIGAEAESSPVFTTALAAGTITPVEVRDTLADGLKTIDVTDPKTPRLVGQNTIALRNAQRVYLARTYAYVAAGADGLVIVDIERPEQMREYQRFNAGLHRLDFDPDAGLRPLRQPRRPQHRCPAHASRVAGTQAGQSPRRRFDVGARWRADSGIMRHR
jgi:threonine dehydratase